MKVLKLTTLTLLAATLLTGCLNEDMQVADEQPSAECGYLSLAALDVECRVHHKPVEGGKPEAELGTRTRTDEVDIDSFDCSIVDEAGEVLHSFKYGARPTENIEMERGRYIFRMSSGEVAGVEWESPVYGCEEPFVINSKATTSLANIICTMRNIQVSVSCTADLRRQLSDDTTTTVSIEPNSQVFGIDETRSAFFPATNAKNTIHVAVKGLYTPEGKDTASAFDLTADIEGVKAGEYSDITLLVEYSDEGVISLRTTIRNWVEDDEIVCDFSSVLFETFIDEVDNKPEIVWVGNDIDTALTLSDDKFDERGNYTDNLYIDIEAKNLLASLVVEIESTNGDFASALAAAGLSSAIDMCAAGEAAAALKLLGYPVNEQVLEQERVEFDLGAQMKQLRGFPGTHSFKITARDGRGGVTEKCLTVVVPGAVVGPVITWVGYDISQRYPIVDGLTADFVVSASAGIKEFTVQIISDVLAPEVLRGIELCDVLNLTNPSASYDSTDPTFVGSPVIGEKLEGLGFPYGDAVLGKSRVTVSITGFLSLLKATGQGDTNFKMTVTDNDGVVVERTVMMYVE